MRAGRDDPQRIDAARRLLAQAPGEAIDGLAALSARLLGASHAQVSIFTDEQVSLTPRAPRRPTADTLAARTFAGEVPVPESGAYLGAAIEVDGTRVGVLCVYDEEPFEWTPHDLDVLRELAIAIAAELERARWSSTWSEHGPARPRLRGGEHRQLRLGPADQRAALGRAADGALRLHGRRLRPAHRQLQRPPASARSRADGGAIASAIERCGDYAADYRVVHDDGAVRWVAARGRVLPEADGEPARMLGAAYDTTAVHSAAERLGRVLETMSTAFFTLDPDWRFTYLNGAAERTLGRRRDELVGQASGTPPGLDGTGDGATGARWRPASRRASSSTTRCSTPGTTSASRRATKG